MDESHQSYVRFAHIFSSPLTALKGAAALLRGRAIAQDQISQMLLETIERNVERLQQAADLVQAHAVVEDGVVAVRIPDHLLPGPHAANGDGAVSIAPVAPSQRQPLSVAIHNPVPLRYYDSPGVVLLVAVSHETHSPMSVLRSEGYELVLVQGALACLDTARQIHPDLIVVDMDLLRDQTADLTQVLCEDPETKTIPLLYLSGIRERLDELPPQASVLHKAADATTILAVAARSVAAGRETGDQAQTILIVDDDADIRTLLALELEGEGYRTIEVGSGTEALLRAQQQRFDLIILDLMLPDFDGFAVLGGLRARAQTALTPIILLSALHAPHEKVQGLRLGADDYMTKPFVPAELSARVRAGIRRSEVEGSANPSTRLPGNVLIERVISRRIEQGTPFAVCYCDLDNFKAYNDMYGFLKGDAVIHQTAHVLVAAAERCGNAEDFVGHIGGDDFVVVTTPDMVTAVCEAALQNFDTLAPLFYDPGARELGYIESTDRRGRPERFPLVSLSIAVVTNRLKTIHHLAEVAQRAVELKKLAKQRPGSAYVVDK